VIRIRKPSRGTLSLGQLIAFGFPAMTHALVASPVYAILPTYYAAKTAVTLAQIGLIAALCRIVDAVSDPVTGYLSDRTRTRFGSRKPWIVCSIGFCGIAVFHLFMPPGDATWLYYLVWSQILFIGFTMFEVPRSAWGAEISREYNERATIGLFVGGFNIAGSLAFYLLPVVMGLVTGQSRIDGQTLRIIAWTYVIAMPLGIMVSAIRVPKGDGVDLKTVSVRAVLKTLVSVRPVQRYLAALFLWGLGQGITLGCAFIFYSDYMKMDAYFALIMGLLFLTQVVSLPVWSRFLPRFDRHRVWACCVASGAVLGPLVLLIPKGESGLGPALVLILVQGVVMAPINVLPGAILGDVIDFDTLKSGTNKAGNLFAVQMVLLKVAMALGGGFAFNLLAAVGYHVGKANSQGAELGLIATFIVVPACFHLAMAGLTWNFPITRERQIIIYKRLQCRT
jgi:Na+/melibiose symporter-like transporter